MPARANEVHRNFSYRGALAIAASVAFASVLVLTLLEPLPAHAEGIPLAAEGTQYIFHSPYHPCESTDSPSPYPQLHFRSRFTTPDGKETIHAARPHSWSRFIAQVTGGNIDKFMLSSALVYYSTPGIEIPKRGSHPQWWPSGGMPTWTLRDLCHWKEKRTITFMIHWGKESNVGHKLCYGFSLGGNHRKEYTKPKTVRDCIKAL